MNRAIYDLLQLAGLALIAGGVWVKWGGASAAMVAGALLIAVPMVELKLFRS